MSCPGKQISRDGVEDEPHDPVGLPKKAILMFYSGRRTIILTGLEGYGIVDAKKMVCLHTQLSRYLDIQDSNNYQSHRLGSWRLNMHGPVCSTLLLTIHQCPILLVRVPRACSYRLQTDYGVYRLQKSVSVKRLTDYRDRGWRLKPSPPWSRASLTTASDAGNTVHQSQLQMQVGLDSGYSLGCVADVASVACCCRAVHRVEHCMLSTLPIASAGYIGCLISAPLNTEYSYNK